MTVPVALKKLVPFRARTLLRDAQWYLSGMPTPPVSSYKRRIIKRAFKASGARIFVETGTFMGDTVYIMSKLAERIYSIELDPSLAAAAQKRFSQNSRINILQGDSGDLIPSVLRGLSEPAVFWLDGHYSGDITAKTDRETPIFQELQAIFSSPIKNHLILIDDAHCFNGTHDYPTLEGLKDFVLAKAPHMKISIKDNIITLS